MRSSIAAIVWCRPLFQLAGTQLNGSEPGRGHSAHAKTLNCSENSLGHGNTSLDVMLFSSPKPRHRSTPASDGHVASSPALNQRRSSPAQHKSASNDCEHAEDIPSAPTSPSSMCISPCSSPSSPADVADNCSPELVGKDLAPHRPMVSVPLDEAPEIGHSSLYIKDTPVMSTYSRHDVSCPNRQTKAFMSGNSERSLDKCHDLRIKQQADPVMIRGSVQTHVSRAA